jgi:anti-anti-sigma factor
MTTPLSIVAQHLDGGVRLAVAGEIDLSSSDTLAAAVVHTIDARAAVTVVVDLHAVAFLDAAGVRVLLQAHRYAGEHGVRLRVAHPCGVVRRVLQLTGALALLTGRPGDDRGGGAGQCGASAAPSLSETVAGRGATSCR